MLSRIGGNSEVSVMLPPWLRIFLLRPALSLNLNGINRVPAAGSGSILPRTWGTTAPSKAHTWRSCLMAKLLDSRSNRSSSNSYTTGATQAGFLNSCRGSTLLSASKRPMRLAFFICAIGTNNVSPKPPQNTHSVRYKRKCAKTTQPSFFTYLVRAVDVTKENKQNPRTFREYYGTRRLQRKTPALPAGCQRRSRPLFLL